MSEARYTRERIRKVNRLIEIVACPKERFLGTDATSSKMEHTTHVARHNRYLYIYGLPGCYELKLWRPREEWFALGTPSEQMINFVSAVKDWVEDNIPIPASLLMPYLDYPNPMFTLTRRQMVRGYGILDFDK